MPRRSTPPPRPKQAQPGAALHLQRAIFAVAIMMVAALGLLGLTSEGAGLAGNTLAGLARGLFGGLAGVWLGLLFIYGLSRLLFRKFSWTYSAVGLSLLFLVAEIYLHLHLPLNTWTPGGITGIPSFSEELAAGTQGEGGGMVGGFFVYLSIRLFGYNGTYLVLGAMVLISLLFLLGPAGLERMKAQSEERRASRQRPPTVGQPMVVPMSSQSPLQPEPPAKRQAERRAEPAPVPAPAPAPRVAPVQAEEPRVDDFAVPGVYRTPPRGSNKQEKNEENTSPVPRSGNQAFQLPPLSLLTPALNKVGAKSQVDQTPVLEQTLADFGVSARVVQVDRGPVITRYELQPAPGVKVSRIVGLADDIALAMAASDVRIEAPIPGKSAVGVEVPNREPVPVRLREVLGAETFQQSPAKLALGLGVDIVGHPVVADLGVMPHLLIAGATGSGKSVCLNTMITSLLYRALPNEVKLLLIDPKRVELTSYEGIPHLVTPVVTDPRRAAVVLKWVVEEMEQRYATFAAAGTRNIEGYNAKVRQKAEEGEEPLPYIVVVIDELADMMLVAAVEVEETICRLAQMARAAGIHLVIATQRPSVDIITGLIKANIPSRVAFAVTSQVDSRTILDIAGAERLLGRGDMLFFPAGAPKPLRVQGALITDSEVAAVARYWKEQGPPEYQSVAVEASAAAETQGEDELFEDAVRLVVRNQQASISLIQRRFRVGYSRAARLVDMMEAKGIVGPAQGSKSREVLITESDLDQGD